MHDRRTSLLYPMRELASAAVKVRSGAQTEAADFEYELLLSAESGQVLRANRYSEENLFIDPDVFHPPTVEDAVDHQR